MLGTNEPVDPFELVDDEAEIINFVSTDDITDTTSFKFDSLEAHATLPDKAVQFPASNRTFVFVWGRFWLRPLHDQPRRGSSMKVQLRSKKQLLQSTPLTTWMLSAWPVYANISLQLQGKPTFFLIWQFHEHLKQEWAQGTDSKTNCWWRCASGPISARVWIGKMGYVPGQFVHFPPK